MYDYFKDYNVFNPLGLNNGTKHVLCLSHLYCLMKINNDDERWSALMQRAQKGDEVAYTELLTELSRVITISLRHKFGEFPFIDDCTQESLIAIHEARHTYQPSRPFKPWMYTLVRYKTIDLLRRQRKHQAIEKVDSENVSLESVLKTSAVTIEDQLSGAALLALIDKPHRDALVYTKFIGLSVEDAAVKLDITPSAVKQRVKRAIAKTSSILAESLQ